MAFLTASRSRIGLLLAAICLSVPRGLVAQAPAPLEASVKAVFLYNFSKYVTWPAAGIAERSTAEVRICVTAEDAFFELLKIAVQGEAVDDRPLVPVALDGLDAARTCQILYVGNAQSPDGRAWLGAVRGRQVLTVADNTLNDETVIAFVRDGERIRFDINRAAAGRHGLGVSSKLLRLARHVRDR